MTFTDADSWTGANGSCLAETRKKAKKGESGKDKLVDVTTIRNKYIIKTNALSQFARTALGEAIESAAVYFKEEGDFYERFKG